MNRTEEPLKDKHSNAQHGSVVVPNNDQALVPIAVRTLNHTSDLEYNLYLWSGDKTDPVLYRECNLPFSQDDADRLARTGIHTLFLHVDDHERYLEQLRDVVAGEGTVPPHERYGALRELNRSVFEAALRGRNLNKLVCVANEQAAQLANIVCDKDLVLDDLFRLMDHDYYTYTHATNVSAYSIVLAFRLGICDINVLTALGSAALLHDLGKRHIPLEILNKPGRLSDDEWHVVRDHPRDAFEELSTRDDLTWDQLMLVYQHHERLDGSGYPVGLSGDELHEWARICAIADIFDALTSDRPYRQPDSVRETCQRLNQSTDKLDREMVKCWIAAVHRS
jgi:HD-GYP domain-containing protein (c-di-GMP phosphodiesterase class II)